MWRLIPEGLTVIGDDIVNNDIFPSTEREPRHRLILLNNSFISPYQHYHPDAVILGEQWTLGY